jgi:GNAT superfamily N-acetyltransferase
LPLGQLGYFECEDDASVAGALLDAGAAWLRAQGAREIVGPINGGAHRAHRLMTRGFEREPFLFEPRNPPFYVGLWESHGFRPVHTWRSYEVSREQLAPLEALIRRGADRDRASGSHEGVELDPRGDARGVLARIHPLLDRAWAGHTGYSSLDPDELAETFGGLLTLMDGHCAGVARHASGHDDGFAFMYPDYVAEVRALAGDATRWGSWLGGAIPPRLVLHTVAVVPEARRTGAPFTLMEYGLRYFLSGGFRELVVALVTEEFRLFERVTEATREYALFGRAL